MISLDEDALICDLAETYHIYDYKQLPVSKVAVFSLGLRENSRIKMAFYNQKIPLETLLLTSIFDNLNILLWSKTKDGQNNVNKPVSITKKLITTEKVEKLEKSFGSGEEFMNEWNRLTKGG